MPKSRPYFTDIENLDFIYDDPKKIDYFLQNVQHLHTKHLLLQKENMQKLDLKVITTIV